MRRESKVIEWRSPPNVNQRGAHQFPKWDPPWVVDAGVRGFSEFAHEPSLSHKLLVIAPFYTPHRLLSSSNSLLIFPALSNLKNVLDMRSGFRPSA